MAESSTSSTSDIENQVLFCGTKESVQEFLSDSLLYELILDL